MSGPLLTRRRLLTGLAGSAGVAYAMPGAAMWGLQEMLVFPAPTLDPALLDKMAAQTGAEVVRPVASDGTKLYGWHRKARPGAAPAGERIVLFFHGNAETVADRIPLQDFLVERGWDVIVVAYRGYPGSEGEPSEAGLKLDAIAAWDLATGALGVAPDRVVIHGKSLGGGVSALLAEVHRPAALVMESTFTSVADVAKARLPLYPVDALLRPRFDTRDRAPSITCPVLVMHGDKDTVIPVSHGRALAKLFPDVRYVECAGLGHGETLPLVDAQAEDAYVAILDGVAGTAAG